MKKNTLNNMMSNLHNLPQSTKASPFKSTTQSATITLADYERKDNSKQYFSNDLSTPETKPFDQQKGTKTTKTTRIQQNEKLNYVPSRETLE